MMIITIFSKDTRSDRSILAANLATHCVREHRSVALLDASAAQHAMNWGKQRSEHRVKPKFAVFGSPGLRSDLEDPRSYLRSHYQEIIIDTDGADSLNTDSALLASNVLVIPAWFRQGQSGQREKLIEHLEEVRLFNPALRILVVDMRTISAGSDVEKAEAQAAADFSGSVSGASLARTVLHERLGAQRAFDVGLSVFEDEPINERAAAEIGDLYREIVQLNALPMQAPNGTEVLHAIQRRLHGKATA
jgi:cellulose biosynthesis protein BcsQ